MPQNVKCEVNNCNYWGQGNLCNAEQIFVVSHHGKQAANDQETDCNTFETRR